MNEEYPDIDNAEKDMWILLNKEAVEVCRAFTTYASAMEYVGAMFFMTFAGTQNIFLNAIQNDTEMLVTTRLADAPTEIDGEKQ